jgi:hypothetical protein
VQTVENTVGAHLLLFMRVRYYEVTLTLSGFALPIASAHLFDLDSRRISRTAPYRRWSALVVRCNVSFAKVQVATDTMATPKEFRTEPVSDVEHRGRRLHPA